MSDKLDNMEAYLLTLGKDAGDILNLIRNFSVRAAQAMDSVFDKFVDTEGKKSNPMDPDSYFYHVIKTTLEKGKYSALPENAEDIGRLAEISEQAVLEEQADYALRYGLIIARFAFEHIADVMSGAVPPPPYEMEKKEIIAQRIIFSTSKTIAASLSSTLGLERSETEAISRFVEDVITIAFTPGNDGEEHLVPGADPHVYLESVLEEIYSRIPKPLYVTVPPQLYGKNDAGRVCAATALWVMRYAHEDTYGAKSAPEVPEPKLKPLPGTPGSRPN